MVISVRENPDQSQLEYLMGWIRSLGLDIRVSESAGHLVLGVLGDVARIDTALICSLDIVERTEHIKEPYKNANRKFHPADTVIDVNGVKLGGGNFRIIAGPCSVESEAQICEVARAVKASGAGILRGGAFKPRTSPYSFQGLRGEGIELLLRAKAETGLPIVSEIMDPSQIPLFEAVDVIQVGTRNMQNFELLKELGHINKPVLLKRGQSSTIRELLMSAEYIMAGGNERVILCERGICTFENSTRNTLDLSAIPVIKAKSHLPVIVDPSHATGYADLVLPMSLAAVAAGADGLIIEVHNNPKEALCDGEQSVTPDAFDALSAKVAAILPYAFKWEAAGI
jgi:3-deoxy-7-phosphoheptulonate synthase